MTDVGHQAWLTWYWGLEPGLCALSASSASVELILLSPLSVSVHLSLFLLQHVFITSKI